MMGAVQPFISGAISKTINMPEQATVEEIEQAYIEAWRLGLKAVAIYRDGCKKTQPLNTGEAARRRRAAAGARPRPQPVRRRLPADCQAICHKFDIAGHEGYIHVGFYEDGTPGEIFIKMAKEGSTISGLMDTIGVLTSMALQYGVPLEVLVKKFSHVRFEPSGFTKNPEIPMAKSLTDYIFRFLGVAVPLGRAAGRGRAGRARRRERGRAGDPDLATPMRRRNVERRTGHTIGFAPAGRRRMRRSPSARRPTRRAVPTAARSWCATALATSASTAGRRAAAPESRRRGGAGRVRMTVREAAARCGAGDGLPAWWWRVRWSRTRGVLRAPRGCGSPVRASP